MATAGIVAGIFAPTSASSTMTNEATTANAGKTQYQITNAAKRCIDPASALTVKLDGSNATVPYRVDYAGGTIIFPTALTTEVVTVTGKYFTLVEVGGIKGYKVTQGAAMLDATDFTSGGWKTFVAGEKSWTCSADGYWVNRAWFDRVGALVVIAFYLDKGASLRRVEGIAYVDGDDFSADSGQLVTEAVKFTGTGVLTYREG